MQADLSCIQCICQAWKNTRQTVPQSAFTWEYLLHCDGSEFHFMMWVTGREECWQVLLSKPEFHRVGISSLNVTQKQKNIPQRDSRSLYLPHLITKYKEPKPPLESITACKLSHMSALSVVIFSVLSKTLNLLAGAAIIKDLTHVSGHENRSMPSMSFPIKDSRNVHSFRSG